MKKLAFILVLAVFAASCGGNNDTSNANEPTAPADTKTTENGNPSYDPKRGEG